MNDQNELPWRKILFGWAGKILTRRQECPQCKEEGELPYYWIADLPFVELSGCETHATETELETMAQAVKEYLVQAWEHREREGRQNLDWSRAQKEEKAEAASMALTEEARRVLATIMAGGDQAVALVQKLLSDIRSPRVVIREVVEREPAKPSSGRYRGRKGY